MSGFTGLLPDRARIRHAWGFGSEVPLMWASSWTPYRDWVICCLFSYYGILTARVEWQDDVDQVLKIIERKAETKIHIQN